MKVFDAQAALGFVISQTAHIEAGVYAIKYADIQYPMLIPVDTSAHPFAKTVNYFSSDKAGVAAWINGNSDDIPMADTEMTQFETSVYTAGIGYGYGWEEINQAQMLGIGLANDKANANTARNAIEPAVNTVKRAVNPVGGTARSACGSPAIKSNSRPKSIFTIQPPPALIDGPLGAEHAC